MARHVEDSRWRARTDASGVHSNSLERGAVWLSGSVRTPDGIVEVYSQGFEPGERKLTRYRVIAGGYMHDRTERGVARRRRGLAIMAVRFAAEVARHVDGAVRRRASHGMPVVRP